MDEGTVMSFIAVAKERSDSRRSATRAAQTVHDAA
jgi:hypothetical protein